MTGRKSSKAPKRRTRKKHPEQQAEQPPPQQQPDDAPLSSPPPNIKKEQPPQPQIVKKILKAENDEAQTLKFVFKSNPDSQMKEFIKKASSKPGQQTAVKAMPKTPAENHSPAVAQELIETDDDVADNLVRLFKTSKSYKNL